MKVHFTRFSTSAVPFHSSQVTDRAKDKDWTLFWAKIKLRVSLPCNSWSLSEWHQILISPGML